MANLSLHGLRVRAEILPKTGERVHLELELDTVGFIALEGEVRWTSEEQPRAARGFGVAFEDPPELYLSEAARRTQKTPRRWNPQSG